MVVGDIKLNSLSFLLMLMHHVTKPLHLNFINDTHDMDKDEVSSFLEKYNELGSKVNKFTQRVEKEWK